MHNIEKEIESLRKLADVEHKQIEDLVRERDLLNSNLRKTQKAVQREDDSLKINGVPPKCCPPAMT